MISNQRFQNRNARSRENYSLLARVLAIVEGRSVSSSVKYIRPVVELRCLLRSRSAKLLCACCEKCTLRAIHENCSTGNRANGQNDEQTEAYLFRSRHPDSREYTDTGSARCKHPTDIFRRKVRTWRLSLRRRTELLCTPRNTRPRFWFLLQSASGGKKSG